jgi:hypothetical protein
MGYHTSNLESADVTGKETSLRYDGVMCAEYCTDKDPRNEIGQQPVIGGC